MGWKSSKEIEIMEGKYAHIMLESTSTILQALKRMDQEKCKLLIVVDNSNNFFGMLSIGDIQRAIIANKDLSLHISEILRPDVKVAHIGDNIQKIKDRMLLKRNEFMPIIDDNRNITDIIFWKDIFTAGKSKKQQLINLPVVIMAGGKGSRLQPLTNVLPKPLIPIGSQTMLEDIMDRFVTCGCHQFYFSVNYKAEFIKLYFDSLSSKHYDIEYFKEDFPLGTAGSLHLIKDKISTTFFVSNCDIIIDDDYANILKYHRDNKNEITCVAAVKSYTMPYGSFKTRVDGVLESITERPEYIFKINTGLYILEPHLLNEIPVNKFYHITELIEKLCKEDRRVGVYPVSEGSWTDIGNWNEYMNYIK